jgi:rhodanese-related sulfurtransferase
MSELQIISTDALAQGNGIALIDVRLADDFASAHLPGATSNCVFEVPFVERMKEIAPDPATSVVVYGAGPDSHESRMAAEKLLRAGYTNVKDYRDGLEGWIAAGHAIEGAGADAATAPAPSGRFQLDLAESKLEWLGRNLLNKHWGTAPLTSGFVEVQDGMVTGGEFTIDLTGLACTDLEGSDLQTSSSDTSPATTFLTRPNFPKRPSASPVRRLSPALHPGCRTCRFKANSPSRASRPR